MDKNIHAHIVNESADCDGRYSREYVEVPNDEEQADEWPEYVFKQRIIGFRVNPMTDHKSTIIVTSEGFTVNEWTDEGYCDYEVKWCSDECDEAASLYRDHTAEAAGY